METSRPLPDSADAAALQASLNELEISLAREVVGVGLTKKAGSSDGINFALVLPVNAATKKLPRLTVVEVPAAAQNDQAEFKGFVAPLLLNAELLDRTIVLLGAKETQVIVVRDLPIMSVPPAPGGILRGDGTWPWSAKIEGADIVVEGAKSTAFGGADDPEDSGETASGVRTKGNPGLEGCSLPMRYSGQNEKLRAALGGSPIPRLPFGLLSSGASNPRGVTVRVTDPATNTTIEVPVIDVGPAKRTGNALDLTVAAARKFQANASARNFKMTLNFRILNGAQFVPASETDAADRIAAPAGGFAARLVASAQNEFAIVRQTHETAPPLRQRIETYWKDLGLDFPGVGEAWSAVFVSWNVLKAGATKANFSFSSRHSQFVHDAINGVNGPPAFAGRPVGEYAPKVGDIIQNNRSGNSFGFDFAKKNTQYESHSAIVVETGVAPGGARFAITVGGNESDSVRRRRIELDGAGKISSSSPTLYISILENLLG